MQAGRRTDVAHDCSLSDTNPPSPPTLISLSHDVSALSFFRRQIYAFSAHSYE
jgi:hypothetical protein